MFCSTFHLVHLKLRKSSEILGFFNPSREEESGIFISDLCVVKKPFNSTSAYRQRQGWSRHLADANNMSRGRAKWTIVGLKRLAGLNLLAVRLLSSPLEEEQWLLAKSGCSRPLLITWHPKPLEHCSWAHLPLDKLVCILFRPVVVGNGNGSIRRSVHLDQSIAAKRGLTDDSN